jgi:Tol biopolymer transport system component
LGDRAGPAKEVAWKIAYADFGGTALKVIGKGDARPHVIARHAEEIGEPSLSPDGRAVAYTRAGDGLFVVTDGGPSRQIVAKRWGVDGIAWSPDGRYLSFGRTCGGRPCGAGPGIYVVSSDGAGRPVRVLASRSHDGCWAVPTDLPGALTWSPDSRRVLATCEGSLMTVRPDGSGIERLTDGQDGAVGSAAWSPDGRLIAFGRNCIADRLGIACDIAVMNPDGSSRRTLIRRHKTETVGPDGVPDWSSDGRVIVQRWGIPADILSVDPRGATRPRVLGRTNGWDVTVGPHLSLGLTTYNGDPSANYLEIRRGSKLVLRRHMPFEAGVSMSMWLG